MLVGRGRESDALARLLVEARSGRGAVLTLRGEPGVGKTALLEQMVDSAVGFRVARAVGVESEAEFAFAALHQLCAPMLDRLELLPGPQRDALGAAFGLTADRVPERLLVGLAALTLLSSTADEQPLLCIVDDAQWLDHASAQALGFVARRLLADPVAIVLATRVPRAELGGLPELVIDGLDNAHARALLASAVRGPLDERVADRIVAEARGNPLALLELPRGFSTAELELGFDPSGAKPVAGRIEETFLRRAQELPGATRRLLLVASAEPLGEPTRLWSAAETLGIGLGAAQAAADAGLMEIAERVRFRHPLVRSAIYRAASPAERREVHRALADATDPDADPDRRAWHLAQATALPDEDVAAELERSAGRAQVRGGLAAAAAFMERAAQLTIEPQRQALRQLDAAEAHLGAGAVERARELLERAAPRLGDPAARAQAMHMEGALRFLEGRGGDTPALLVDAAMALRDIDVRAARATLIEAIDSAMWAGNLTIGMTLADVARAGLAVPPPAGDESAANLLLTGFTERFTTGSAAAADSWRRAVQAYLEGDGDSLEQWQSMVWDVSGELLDFESQVAVSRKWLRVTRERGALATLPIALTCMAWVELIAGRTDTADALITEGEEIAAATKLAHTQGIGRVAVLAWRGRERECRAVARAVAEDAHLRRQGFGVTLVELFLTDLELALGRYDAARVRALQVFEDDPLNLGTATLGDVVEATVRAGDRRSAQAALERLSERAEATGLPWGLGLLARSRALLADDADAEALYEEALDQLARSGVGTEHARAHLLYGEWLRRRRRRRDARKELRAAHDMFSAFGTTAWADRAAVELRATGERASARVEATRDELTAQEQQVAQLAAAGESNADIAAQLFISPHTVAYHLRKVFVKLGINSRNQLGEAIGGSAEVATG
jgi:DNA-binding CsgD family transcriptional regulator